MKSIRKTTLLFLLLLVAMNSYSQFNLAEMYQGWFPRKDNAPKLMHRLTIDIKFNRWREEPVGISLEPFSMGVNIYRMIDIPFNNHIGIAIGGGISSENYHHNGHFITTVLPDASTYTSLEPFPGNYGYKRNKVSLNYFDIPFELRFRSSEKPRFSIYPGIKAGYLFNAHTKTTDGSGKYKDYNIPFNKIRYGASLRMGWGKNLHVYAYYQISSLFEKNKGVEIYPMQIGFTFYIF